MAIELSLSQVIELSGGRPRRMRQLANEGVFIPTEAERTGRAARLYPVSEAAIACIIATIDEFSVTTSVLAGVAKCLRGFYRVQSDYGFKNHHEGKQFALRDFYLHTIGGSNVDPDEYATALGLAERPRAGGEPLAEGEFRRIMDWVELEQSRTGEKVHWMSLRASSEGEWQFYVSDHVIAPDGPCKGFMVLNLGEILSVLR